MNFLGTSSGNGAREKDVQHPYILVQDGTYSVAMLIEIVESTLIKYLLSKNKVKEKTVKDQTMQCSLQNILLINVTQQASCKVSVYNIITLGVC